MIIKALDPSRSVVVEACAGSGKTWLLASRIVRLLLAGVPPGEILAITFTRKAAREIEARVVGWLHLLATAPRPVLEVFLAERGVVADDAVILAARSLYERVMTAQPGLAVNTFHGWFLQLIEAAPLSANLSGAVLTEADSRQFDALWQSFAESLQADPGKATTQALLRLLGVVGLDSLRRMIRRAYGRRSEWLAFGKGTADIPARVVAALQGQFGAGIPGEALAAFFACDWASDVHAYLGLLEKSSLKTDQANVSLLEASLVAPEPASAFSALCKVFLTSENALRKREITPTLEKRFTPAGAQRLVTLHAQLGGRVLASFEQQMAERIVAFNGDVCVLFDAFLQHAAAFKAARRQIDFVDAEWNVLQLLDDEATAAFLQARLDACYSHVLLDEFQDTNPLQWQILLAWLGAYCGAPHPAVFLVGDPKQSIYRFRRAEPRLFSEAADFLESTYGAVRCAQNETRRNAPAIVDVVNAIFSELPRFAPFSRQSALAKDLPGRVELLPLCGKAASTDDPQGAPRSDVLRNPLQEAETVAEDARLSQEAAQLAAKIGEITGHKEATAWQIEVPGADGKRQVRPARYEDILLLVRTRTHLPVYERALSAAGIPFFAGARGGLLDTLEARDLMALLEFIVMPADDLKLAHALRSPIFACSDEDLLALSAQPGDTWWRRLQDSTAGGDALGSARLQRARRLLDQWLQAANRLPAHDLLDTIYHQGEVIARYRQAVPPALGASVEANLRAFLLLTLELDGGRYPSLPRCLDALRELREGESGEAPDEGEIEHQAVESGRVRILTIHGAKGLEAPIVWLLGANAPPRPPDAWDMLVDWPPEAPAPQHLSFTGRKEDRGAARQFLFEQEAAAAEREELNVLYVALTRARQVFIASGCENSRYSGPTPYHYLSLALQALGGGLAYGESLPRSEVACSPDRAEHAARSPMAADAPLSPVGERRAEADAATRFGLLLHALMERQTQGKGNDGWWLALGYADSEYRQALPVAERLLASEPLQRFFAPQHYRRAWNEVELVDAAGALLRIDRLVERDEAFWVLDYKSSRPDGPRMAAYREQVSGYCRVVSGVFRDRVVRGALIFADASFVEVT